MKKKLLIIFSAILVFLFVLVCALYHSEEDIPLNDTDPTQATPAITENDSDQEQDPDDPVSVPAENSSFQIQFIDVGQADAALVSCDGYYMLIDGGNREDSSLIYSILQNAGIEHLDFLVATHGDYDHMGEAINLVNNFKVEKVIFNCGEFNELEKE